MSQLTYKEFMNNTVYDMAAKTGSRAVGRVDKSTINNLLSIFQGTSDVSDAAKLLLTYIVRQSARHEIPRDVSRDLASDIKVIYESFKEDPNKLRNAINKYLVLIKWFFESEIRNVRNFAEFVYRASGGAK